MRLLLRHRWRFWLAERRMVARRYIALIATLFHPHIHKPGDGRGARRVFVDGEAVDRVFYADTRKGFVRAHYQPIRLNRRGESARFYKRRGVVTIEPLLPSNAVLA